MAQSYNLGFCTGRFNTDTIDQMLRYLGVTCIPTMVRNVEDTSTRFLDALFLIDPVFHEHQREAFLRYIESGGTALMLVTAPFKDREDGAALLTSLGLRVASVKSGKRFSMVYARDYPVTHKRERNGSMFSKDTSTYAIFSPMTDELGVRSVPLIHLRHFFWFLPFAMKVVLGSGTVVVMNSFGLPEDRADMLEFLLKASKVPKHDYRLEVEEDVKIRLPGIVRDCFSVYDEIPLEIICRKVDSDRAGMDPVDVLLLIEDLIREGEMAAKIRGFLLVKL